MSMKKMDSLNVAIDCDGGNLEHPTCKGVANFDDHILTINYQSLQLVVNVVHPSNMQEIMGVQWNQPKYQHGDNAVQELTLPPNDLLQDNGAYHANDDTIEYANGKFLN